MRDNPDQADCAETFIKNGAWVSILALTEAIWVLSTVYQLAPAKLCTLITRLLAHEKLTLQDPDVILAAADLFRANPKLGFTDCIVLELARKAGHLPLGTFDKGLAKRDEVHAI